MDYAKRNQLAKQLYNDAHFMAKINNRDRVQYVFEHVMSYEEFRAEIKANVNLVQQKSKKSLPVATNYKTMAEAFQKQAANGYTTKDGNLLDLALQSYDKVSEYWIAWFWYLTSIFIFPRLS